jgi:ankyrin repeat protein
VPVPQYFLESFGTSGSPAFLNWRRAQHTSWDLGKPFVEESYPTPLYAVSSSCYFKLALAILEWDDTQSDRRGQDGTPLQFAVAGDSYRLVERLLETGAHVDADPGRCGTAIAAACYRSDLKVLKLLLANSSKITLNTSCQFSVFVHDHETPLCIATRQGNEEAVDLLLEAGANPNSRGKIFGDALQMAAALGYERIVRTLLHHGVDPTSTHGSFGTAYTAALHSSLAQQRKKRPGGRRRSTQENR